MKKKFVVEIYLRHDNENSENDFEQFLDSMTTYAISKQQAINNVKYRYAGKTSQYKPISTSGHWDEWVVYRIKE